MKLRNQFPFVVRNLYLDCYECWMCGSNGNGRGGLEIHHVTGRDSAAAFNSSCLCHFCHENIEHTNDREAELFLRTLKHLYDIEYRPTDDDFNFLKDHHYLINDDVQSWLIKL